MNLGASHHALPSPIATKTKTISFPPFVLTFLHSAPFDCPFILLALPLPPTVCYSTPGTAHPPPPGRCAECDDPTTTSAPASQPR
ncbi:hypothetical protein CCHR01_15742 [Colletotrichum chrysophilum]|uniref:Uncharacterized protein n=1 Tax=Colletotrichum chrysophilum TaxID=1836956 RepID=A0AAD9A5S1_9PEZI|nr:hypothetical protein CCHR01_15742 [Colletotrichum chrysophilum]